MSSTAPDLRPLGMTESYHATQCWLAFIGEPTTRIEDPTDGVVQLYTDRFIARVRVSADPASQSAVIAMLRAAVENSDTTMVMFSPTGYNSAAIEFAETRGIPLFTLTTDGDVVGETVAARSLIPDTEYEPPYATEAGDDEQDAFMATIEEAQPEEEEPEPEDPFDAGTSEWKSCPRCGASQHSEIPQCKVCGADINERVALLGGTSTGHTLQPSAAPRRGTSSLKCRECGSHDIELIHY